MLLAWSKFFPFGLCRTEQEAWAERCRQKALHLGSTVAVWLSPAFSLLPEHSEPMHPGLTRAQKQEAGEGRTGPGGSSWHNQQNATAFRIYCTSWLRSPALCSGQPR